MRSFLFIFILFFSSSVFAACPAGTTSLNYSCSSPDCGGSNASFTNFVKNFIHSSRPANKIVTAPGPQYYSTWVCELQQAVDCNDKPATPVLTAGQYGVNFSCQPRPCPDSHPNSAANFTQCKDSNGCTQDQSFIAGQCINKKMEDVAQRCIAAGAGGPVTVTVPSDGTSPTCTIGILGNTNGSLTAAACQTAPGGTACITPANGLQSSGSQCGTFNGAPICVSSSETAAVGTSSVPVGSSTQNGTPRTLEEEFSANGQTTKIIKEITPQTTTTTTVNDSSPVQEGQTVNGGAGPAPVPPITCSNGKPAANLQSCDSNVICPDDSYLAYGSCIKMPTRTTVTAKDVTVTTTTVKNDSDNTVVSETSSTATTYTPVKNLNPASADSQRAGQCDPTAKNYNECVGLITSVSDTEKQTITDAVESKTDTGLTTWNSEQKSSIQGTSNGLGISTSVLDTMLNPFKISGQTCTSFTVNFLRTTRTLDCTKFEFFKKLFGWALYLYTIYYIFMLIIRPVEK